MTSGILHLNAIVVGSVRVERKPSESSIRLPATLISTVPLTDSVQRGH